MPVSRRLRVALAVAAALAGGVQTMPTLAADAPKPPDAVTLSINPDGSAVWNGEPLADEPSLEAKLAHRTQQTPRLQLDLQFHSVGSLSDSNRKTLLDILELVARYGYVHVENVGNGARLTVLGPSASDTPPPSR